MGICGNFGCANRRGFSQYSFFKMPKVVYGQGYATRLLSGCIDILALPLVISWAAYFHDVVEALLCLYCSLSAAVTGVKRADCHCECDCQNENHITHWMLKIRH